MTGSLVQSISLLNNCLHLIVGLSTGNINLYDTNGSFSLLTIVEQAHLAKYDEAVNCIVPLPNSDPSNNE